MLKPSQGVPGILGLAPPVVCRLVPATTRCLGTLDRALTSSLSKVMPLDPYRAWGTGPGANGRHSKQDHLRYSACPITSWVVLMDPAMKSATPEVGKGSRRESPSGWPRSLPAVMIVAVTFVAYAAALSLGFVFDDHVLIVTNDSI